MFELGLLENEFEMICEENKIVWIEVSYNKFMKKIYWILMKDVIFV